MQKDVINKNKIDTSVAFTCKIQDEYIYLLIRFIKISNHPST